MTGVLIAFQLASLILLGWVFFQGYFAGVSVPVRQHITLALAATAFTVFSQSMTMMYSAAIGRMIRQAVEKGGLDPEYVVRGKNYRSRIFRMGTVAILVVMVQTILGGGAHTRVFPLYVHETLGIAMMLIVLCAVILEIRYLISCHLLGHRVSRDFISQKEKARS